MRRSGRRDEGSDLGVGVGVGLLGTRIDLHRVDRHAHSARLWLSTAAAWILGVSGSLAVIRGWAPVVMAPDVQRVAEARVLGGSALLAVSLTILLPTPRLRALTAAAACLALPAFTASNAGRLLGTMAATSVVVAHFALVDADAARTRDDARGYGSAAWAILPLLVAQLFWGALATPAPTIALFGAAGGTILLHRRHPESLRRVSQRARESIAPVISTSRGLAIATSRGLVGSSRELSRTGVQATRAVLAQLRRLRARWSSTWGLSVGAALGAALIAAPAFRRFATGSEASHTDFQTHLWWASQVHLFPPRVTMPHPMLHLPTAILGRAVAAEWAITIVAATAVGFTMLALVWLGTERFAERRGLPAGLSIAFAASYLIIESPGVLASAIRWGNPSDWTTTNHMYISPTETVLVPFAIALLILIRRTVLPLDRATFGAKAGTILAATTAATVLSKPTLPLALLAVVPAYLVLTRRLERPRLQFLALSFMLPGIALAIGQYLFVRSGGAIVAYGSGGIEFRPLGTIKSVGLDKSGPLLLTPLLVIPISLWAGFRRYLLEPLVALSLGSLAVGLTALLLLQETGPRSMDGNFTKPAFISWAMVNAMSWRFLLGEFVVARGLRQWPRWAAPAALLLAMSLAAGIATYLDALGLIDLPFRDSTG